MNLSNYELTKQINNIKNIFNISNFIFNKSFEEMAEMMTLQESKEIGAILNDK